MTRPMKDTGHPASISPATAFWYWLMHRTPRGVLDGTLFMLPSLLILIALSWIYIAFGNVPAVAGIRYGIKPAVVAIVLAAAWRIGSRTLRNAWLVSIAAATLFSIAILRLPFPLIVVAAAILGLLGGRLLPASFGATGGHAVSLPALPYCSPNMYSIVPAR